jgi:hypothetical protein
MELVRSDSPDLAHIASAGARASRNWYTLGFACAANVLAILIVLALSLGISVRVATWLSVPVLLSLNGYVLWRAQSSQRRWVVVGCADRLYVRLFAWRSGDRGGIADPDVLVLEPPEIASMLIRSVEVFLYGPKPKPVEWLVIKPARTAAEDISSHIRPLLTQMDHDRAVLVAHDDGCLTIDWRWWRPGLRTFLQRVARECPSVVIAPGECSELDLNGIWHGFREKPNAEQRRMLVQAIRLGFGCKCVQLLSLYRFMPLQEAGAYLAEIEREETGTENPTGCSSCRF